MTTTDTSATLPLNEDKLPPAGTRIHFLRAVPVMTTNNGGVQPESRVFVRGEETILTAEMLACSFDSLGISWTSKINTEGYAIGFGAFPESEQILIPGSEDWSLVKAAAKAAAWRLPSESQQYEAIDKINREFGDAPRVESLVYHEGQQQEHYATGGI